MADAVMAGKKIDPHELRRQRSQRERRRNAARRKSREANPDSDPASEEPADLPPENKREIKESDITGLKYFDKLAPLLERLHDDACERDKAGNRELHFDQYCLLVLLYLFNPVVTSLRGIQQASELGKVQKKLGCQRAALGSLSEAATVFDAERLKEIIAELGAELKPLARDARLQDIDQALVLVDGSLIAALPSLMEASWRKRNEGSGLVKWRLHTHFEVDRYVPTRIDVTPDDGGEHDERAVLERTIERDRLYVMDRGYAKFALFNKIVKANSSYVCRLRDNSAYEVVEERELTDADRAAGILSDQIVLIGQSGKANARPDHKIRLVCVKCSPHTSRGKYKGGSSGVGSDGVLRIATNLLDPPAEIIGLIYSQRWAIEIFFRFFKHLLGCRHLLSHNQNGIEIQTYCAIIACLLISLWTGRKPTKRTYEMICFYFLGVASEDELLAHLTKLKRHDEASSKKR
ncbi:IS4 family transposase [Candidatus Uhrbacteria bacterium]|nr:IS4 family transposase [Candidatus Uhrbacteria bacterium]